MRAQAITKKKYIYIYIYAGPSLEGPRGCEAFALILYPESYASFCILYPMYHCILAFTAFYSCVLYAACCILHPGFSHLDVGCQSVARDLTKYHQLCGPGRPKGSQLGPRGCPGLQKATKMRPRGAKMRSQAYQCGLGNVMLSSSWRVTWRGRRQGRSLHIRRPL